MNVDKAEKVARLREMEAFIYQVAYYMLNDEEPALEAAKQTIREAITQEQLFELDQAALTTFIRDLTIHKSLRVHFASYSD